MLESLSSQERTDAIGETNLPNCLAEDEPLSYNSLGKIGIGGH